MFFNNFEKIFKADISMGSPILLHDTLKEAFSTSNGAIEFLQNNTGKSFSNGLYRIHKVNEINRWNIIVSNAFPEFAEHILCFSYDWLGRHFALDFNRVENNEPLILMLEPGTGEAFEISATFGKFHNEELTEYQDATLAVNFFNEWKRETNKILLPEQCVGYRVPLFLGGEDSLSNLDLYDMEVYWDICGQLLNKVRNLPVGTKVNKLTIS